MLRKGFVRLGGAAAGAGAGGHVHHVSAGTRWTARLFNTTPEAVQGYAGHDITALSPLIVVCAAGAVVCGGYMYRTMASHPDVYLGFGSSGRSQVIRDNQAHSKEHHQHFVRRHASKPVYRPDGEHQMQIFAALNKAGAGSSARTTPEEAYARAVAQGKKIEAAAAAAAAGEVAKVKRDSERALKPKIKKAVKKIKAKVAAATE